MRQLSTLVLVATLFQIAFTEQPPPPPSDTYPSPGKRGGDYRRERSGLSPSPPSAATDKASTSARTAGVGRGGGGRRTSAPASTVSSSSTSKGSSSNTAGVLSDDLSSIGVRRDGGHSDDDVMVLSRGVRFRPEGSLSIESPVCIPAVSEFWVDNVLGSDIHLYSVTSSSPQFYPVTFQAQALAPHESMSIQLLFLPYHIRSINATVTIVTSVGDFTYSVVGTSASNPYALRPFIGNRIISGVPLDVPIVMRNPHSEALRIREIFTTEEFLSLHSSGEQGGKSAADGSRSSSSKSGGGASSTSAVVQKDGGSSITPSVREADHWLIESGVEKEVISLSMASSAPGHYFGYVHIKTDADKIVIPVDLLVLEGGILPVDPLLDFGILTSSNAQKTIDFRVMNSGSSDISILEIVPTTSDPQLSIEIGQRLIKSGEEAAIASLTYTGTNVGKIQNKLLVMTNHPSPAYASFEVPYEVSVLRGGIGLMFNDSVFYLPLWNRTSLAASQLQLAEDGKAGHEVRKLVLTNYFSVPLTLQGVTAETCNEVIAVTAMPEVLTANKMDRWGAVTLVYNVSNAIHISSSKDGLPFTCWLELWTNISSHRIPLHIMDGDVNVKLLNDKGSKRRSAKSAQLPVDPDNFDANYIDFKTLSISSPEGLLFSVANRNPRKIPFYLSATSEPLCVCVEALIDMNEIEEMQPLFDVDRFFPYKFVPHKKSGDKRCTCYNANSDVIVDGSSPFDGDDNDVIDGSMSSDEDSSVNPTYEDPVANLKPFVRIPNGHAALVSVHFQSVLIGPTTVSFNWTSPYQSKTFVVDYIGVTGIMHADVNTDEEAMTSFIVGNRQRINVVALSTLPYEATLKHIGSTSNLFRADVISKLSAIPSSGSDPVVIGSLTPKFSCLPDKSSKSSKKVLKKKPSSDPLSLGFWDGNVYYPYWKCVYTLLAQVSNKTATQMMTLINGIHNKLSEKNFAAAHDSIVTFQGEWDKMFSNGLVLGNFDSFVTTDVTLTQVTVPEVHVSLPTEMTPPVASVVMPPVITGGEVVYFVRVLNPFDMDVSFRLADSESPVFAPGIVSTPPSRELVAEVDDAPFVPAAYPKNWIPASCREPNEYSNDNFGDDPSFAESIASQTIKSSTLGSGPSSFGDIDVDTKSSGIVGESAGGDDFNSFISRSRWFTLSRNITKPQDGNCGVNGFADGWCGAQTASTFVFPDTCSSWIYSLLRQGVETYPIVWGVHAVENASVFSDNINWGENPSLSPIYLGDITQNEVVVAPGTFSFLGPILFRPQANGLYEKNIYIVNSFSGTEKLSLSAESGSADLTMATSAFVERAEQDSNASSARGLYVAASDLIHGPKIDSCTDRSFPRTTISTTEFANGLIRNAILNTPPASADDVYETDVVITAKHGFIEIKVANEGIINSKVGLVEIDGVSACGVDSTPHEDKNSSTFVSACPLFPLQNDGCSSLSIFIPHELYCGATKASINIRLYSVENDGKRDLLLDTSISTVLSPTMQYFCHEALEVYYSQNPLFKLMQRVVIFLSAGLISIYCVLFYRSKRDEDAIAKCENIIIRSTERDEDIVIPHVSATPEKRPRSQSRQNEPLAPVASADILQHVPEAHFLGGDELMSAMSSQVESAVKESKGLNAYRKFSAKRREVLSQSPNATSVSKKKAEDTNKAVANTPEPETPEPVVATVKDSSIPTPSPTPAPKVMPQKEHVNEAAKGKSSPSLTTEKGESPAYPTTAKAAMKPSPSKANKSPGAAPSKTQDVKVAEPTSKPVSKEVSVVVPTPERPALNNEVVKVPSPVQEELPVQVENHSAQFDEIDMDDSLDLTLIADLVKLPSSVRTPEPVKPHSLLNKESPSGNMSILYQGIYGSPGDNKPGVRSGHASAPPPGFQKREEVVAMPSIPVVDNRVQDRGATPRIGIPPAFRPELTQPQLKKNVSDSSMSFDEKFVDDLLLSPMASDGVFASTENTASLFGGAMDSMAQSANIAGSSSWNSSFRSQTSSLPDYDIFNRDSNALGLGLLGNPSAFSRQAPTASIEQTSLPTSSMSLGYGASASLAPAPAPSGGHQRLLEVTYDNVRDVVSYQQQLQQQRNQYSGHLEGHSNRYPQSQSPPRYSALEGDFAMPGSNRMGNSGMNMSTMNYSAQGGRLHYGYGTRSSGLQYHEESQSNASTFGRGSGNMGGPMSAPYVPAAARTHTVLGAQLRQLEDMHMEPTLSARYAADYIAPSTSMSHGRTSSPRFGLSATGMSSAAASSTAPPSFTRTNFSSPATTPNTSAFGSSGFFSSSHVIDPLLDASLEDESKYSMHQE